MNKQKERIKKVVDRLPDDDNQMLNQISECIDIELDEIHQMDGFGTEGQADPRGDFRDNEWSMWNVQDVDDIE